MYLRELREKMKKENPKLIMAEFMKQASMNWTRMTSSEKKRYENLVEKDRVRYDQQILDMKRCIETEEATPSELASNYDENYSEIDNGYLMNREDLS